MCVKVSVCEGEGKGVCEGEGKGVCVCVCVCVIHEAHYYFGSSA